MISYNESFWNQFFLRYFFFTWISGDRKKWRKDLHIPLAYPDGYSELIDDPRKYKAAVAEFPKKKTRTPRVEEALLPGIRTVSEVYEDTLKRFRGGFCAVEPLWISSPPPPRKPRIRNFGWSSQYPFSRKQVRPWPRTEITKFVVFQNGSSAGRYSTWQIAAAHSRKYNRLWPTGIDRVLFQSYLEAYDENRRNIFAEIGHDKPRRGGRTKKASPSSRQCFERR
jgi:hypothetical protein